VINRRIDHLKCWGKEGEGGDQEGGGCQSNPYKTASCMPNKGPKKKKEVFIFWRPFEQRERGGGRKKEREEGGENVVQTRRQGVNRASNPKGKKKKGGRERLSLLNREGYKGKRGERRKNKAWPLTTDYGETVHHHLCQGKKKKGGLWCVYLSVQKGGVEKGEGRGKHTSIPISRTVLDQ